MKSLDDCNSVIDPELEFARMLQESEQEKRQAKLAEESKPAVYVEVEVLDSTYPLPKLKSIN